MPLQPICILCLSICDALGWLSSCNHFFCARCAGRLPPPLLAGAAAGGGGSVSSSSSSNAAPCPICRKPYQLARLDTPSLRPLFQEPSQLLSSTTRVLCNQMAHQQQIVQRMREALKLLHGKYQAAERRASDATQALTRERARCAALEQRLAQHEQALTLHRNTHTPVHTPRRQQQQQQQYADGYHATYAPQQQHLHSAGRRSTSRADAAAASVMMPHMYTTAAVAAPTSALRARSATMTLASAGRRGSSDDAAAASHSMLGWSATSHVLKHARDGSAVSAAAADNNNTSGGSLLCTPCGGSVSCSLLQMHKGTTRCAPPPPRQQQQATQPQQTQPRDAGVLRTTFRLSTPLMHSLHTHTPSAAAAPLTAQRSLHSLLATPRSTH